MHTLEWNQIQENLTRHCVTASGKVLASTLEPSFEKEIILHTLQETAEAETLQERLSAPPISDFADITKPLAYLKSHSHLSAKNLLEIAQIFKMAEDLKHYFYCDIVEETDFPILSAPFAGLYANHEIYKNITSSILDEITIADTASPALNRIRRTLSTLESAIREKLNHFIHSATYSKYIMEPIVTIRNNRFVVPIKEEYRSNVQGFIHDISSSGSTLFVEPIAVFELNNRLNNVKAEEAKEIEKILANLSDTLFPYIENLENNLQYFSYLDFVFAKAKFAKHLGASMPEVTQDKVLSLVGATHPLIEKEVAVPMDITLGDTYSTLIITGPNTGGKTVALKTVGLLTLMTYAGLFIPAKPSSKICLFDHVFVDIGDEQSIQESLSTFSSHIVTIKQIIEQCTSSSLILLDELGSGTDPEEGECLAISLLEFFHTKKALTLATTHYSGLKQFALVTPGFKNASFEFDLTTLSPTYRLLLGVPGKSNAFEICKRLGIPNTILTNAKSKMHSDSLSFEDMIKKMHEDSLEIANNKKKSEEYLQEITLQKQAIEEERLQLQQLRNDKVEKATMQAREILLDAKEEANRIIASLNENANVSQANKLRNNLNHSIKNLSNTLSQTSSSSNKEIAKKKSPILVGSTVLVRSLGQVGKVLTKPNKSDQVQVQIGLAKMHVKCSDLEITTQAVAQSEPTLQSFRASTTSKAKTVSSEIMVIGYTVEEALFVIDKYLDDAVLSSLPSVRIVHGKGSGTLRTHIHTFLKTHPHVKSFRLGTFVEGEMGVTVVELK